MCIRYACVFGARRERRCLFACPELPRAGGAQAGGFTIWNAGKEGKRLYKSLSDTARAAVRAFADVDPRKLARGVYDDVHAGGRRVPILHFRRAFIAVALRCLIGCCSSWLMRSPRIHARVPGAGMRRGRCCCA